MPGAARRPRDRERSSDDPTTGDRGSAAIACAARISGEQVLGGITRLGRLPDMAHAQEAIFGRDGGATQTALRRTVRIGLTSGNAATLLSIDTGSTNVAFRTCRLSMGSDWHFRADIRLLARLRPAWPRFGRCLSRGRYRDWEIREIPVQTVTALREFAELAVILLLFLIGLETEPQQLRRLGRDAL